MHKANEPDFRDCFDSSVELCCIANLEGYFSHLNGGWSKVLGWSEEELKSKPYLEFVHPNDRERTIAEAQKISEGVGAVNFINRYQHKNGKFIVLSWFGSLTKDRKFICATARDITHERNLESLLQQQSYALNSATIVGITDKQGIITFANKNFADISGYDIQELIGKDHRILNSGLHSKTFMKNMWNTIQSKRIWKGELRNKRKDGSYYWVRTIIVPFVDEGGEITQFVSIRQDITHEKIQNEVIRGQQMKLTESSRIAAVGEMSAGIAHEINNPLAILIGKSSQLRTMAEKGQLDGAKVVEHCKKIEEMGTRISKIVRGLRSFARDAGNDPMEAKDLGQIANDALEFCEARFKSKGIRIIKELNSGGTAVNCRPVQLSQVLLNLLNNAHDAVLNLEDKWVKISSTLQGNIIKIRIEDAGSGIPAHIADNIMTPFFTTKEVGKGTGLGLSISFGIVQSHGGKLYLDRDADHTCFVVELPVAGEQKVAQAA